MRTNNGQLCARADDLVSMQDGFRRRHAPRHSSTQRLGRISCCLLGKLLEGYRRKLLLCQRSEQHVITYRLVSVLLACWAGTASRVTPNL
jgi:hypothetical protein